MNILCFLDKIVFLIQVFGGEIVRNNLAFFTPDWIHLFQSNMIALCQKTANITRRAVRVDRSFLVQQRVNGLAVAQYNDIGGSKLEREYRAVFGCPVTEPGGTNYILAMIKQR